MDAVLALLIHNYYIVVYCACVMTDETAQIELQ